MRHKLIFASLSYLFEEKNATDGERKFK